MSASVTPDAARTTLRSYDGGMPNAYRWSTADRLAGWTTGLVLALLGSVAAAQPPFSSEEIAAERAHAVTLGRAGDYDGALALLETLHEGAPADRGVLYDQTAILGWAGRDRDVLANAIEIDPAAAPGFVLEAVAKSARNLRDFDMAHRWYAQALEQSPNDLDARLGLAMVQAEMGQAADARETLAPLSGDEPDARRIGLARAYVEQQSRDNFAALAEYEALLSLNADDADALRGKALILRALLMPRQALEIAQAHPDILSAAEVERLRADETAIRVRFTARTPYPAELTDGAFERTLDELEQALAATTDPATERALRSDRVVTLADQDRCAEAILEYEALESATAGDLLPYVLTATGKAYLQCRRPERAAELLERASSAAPEDPEPKFALVYAYLDLERHRDALELAYSLSAATPPARAPGAPPSPAATAELRAEIVAALAEAYADQLAQSQRHFERLLAAAPANGEIRRELANVYRWRGWQQRSLFEYRQVLSLDPTSLYTRLGYAETLLDTRDYGPVPAEVAALSRSYPRNPSVRQLARHWQLHERSELDVEASTGDSSGTTFGSDQYRLDAVWLTRPFATRFRGSIRLHDAFAAFPEGDGRRKRIGAGLEYRTPDWLATGEISANRSGSSAVGASIGVDRTLSDYWTLGGRLEIDSDDMQLRAARAGIRTDAATLTARFAPNESASVRIGWRYQALTDGNRGQSVFAEARKRVRNGPRSKLELSAEISAGGNRSADVPYFSPRHDATWLLGATHQWRIFRHYERSLTQSIAVAAGRYDQSDFESGAIWRASYRLRWQARDSLALSIGVDRNRMFYDGSPEHGTYFVAGVEARL